MNEGSVGVVSTSEEKAVSTQEVVSNLRENLFAEYEVTQEDVSDLKKSLDGEVGIQNVMKGNQGDLNLRQTVLYAYIISEPNEQKVRSTALGEIIELDVDTKYSKSYRSILASILNNKNSDETSIKQVLEKTTVTDKLASERLKETIRDRIEYLKSNGKESNHTKVLTKALNII